MQHPLIAADNISKIFETADEPFTLFEEISLSIYAHDTISCVGRSGEGKSTLLHILGTIEPATTGTISIQGKELSTLPVENLRNSLFGFIFQSFHLLEDSDVLANILLPVLIARKSSPYYTERAHYLIDHVGLTKRTATKTKFLSGGEKQRVAIARALIMEPHIIFADEPTGNLDSLTAEPIVELLFNTVRAESTALFLVTHQQELSKMCQKQYVLDKGHLTLFET